MDDMPNLKNHLDRFGKVITSTNKPYGLNRAREERFSIGEKIISLRKCSEPTFTYTDFPCYVSQTYFSIKSDRIDMKHLTTILNSKLIKFLLKHKGKIQGDLYQVDKEPLMSLPIKNTVNIAIYKEKANTMIELHKELNKLVEKFKNRLISNLKIQKMSKKLSAFYELSFDEFLGELTKQKINLKLSEQDKWQEYFDDYKEKITKIKNDIAICDREIDRLVYTLYNLTDDEIKIMEG